VLHSDVQKAVEAKEPVPEGDGDKALEIRIDVTVIGGPSEEIRQRGYHFSGQHLVLDT
jgi:hypothetical protein